MFHSASERVVPVVAPAAARLTSVYQAAAHDVLLPLMGEISPPPKPHARSFRDRVHSPLGRFIARFLARWLVIAPMPQPVQQLALLFPVSILAPFVNEKRAENPTAEEHACAAASGSIGTRLSECANRNRAPILPNIGGKLAFAGNGNSAILFGTAYSKFGAVDPNGLNGVRSATLGTTTLVNTDPARIVTGDVPGFPLRSAEKFKLKYRAVPTGIEITGPSKIEFVTPNEQKLGEIPAPLIAEGDKKGTGEVELPLGFTFPKSPDGVVARPRLVVNVGTPEQIVGIAKSWQLEPMKVDVAHEEEPARITADAPEVLVTATSAEWHQRYEKAAAEQQAATSRMISWQASPAPAAVTPAQVAAESGVFHSKLVTGTAAGSVHQVKALSGDVVVGVSQAEVRPGPAHAVTLTAPKTSIPADGATKLVVQLEAKDIAGNPVEDGTGIEWEIDADGDLAEFDKVTTSGKATAKYRAGLYDTGTVTIMARVDGVEGKFDLNQAEVTITVTTSAAQVGGYSAAFDVEAELTSAAGPVSDEAEFVWLSSVGRLVPVEPLSNGRARGRWTAVKPFFMERIYVQGHLGAWKGKQIVEWELRPASIATAVMPMAIAGDMSADGSVPLKYANGTEELVPVKATSTYRAVGLPPGKHITLQIGSSQYPNMMPVAHYDGANYVSGGTVPDVTGAHHGTSTSGVKPVADAYPREGFHFDGGGVIAIPHDEEFSFSAGFQVQTAVRPPPGGGAQTLIEKAGEYRLALDNSDGVLRARFTVTTDQGGASVVSSRAVTEGTWSLVTGKYHAGRLWVGVGDAEDSVASPGTPQHGIAELLIGPGLVGDLDEIRVFDLTKAPTMVFANGQTSLEFVADASGAFTTEVRSTGQLFLNRTANYYDTLGDRSFGLAQDGGPSGEETVMGWTFNEIVVFVEEEGVGSRSLIAAVPSKLLANQVKMVQGIFGTEVREFDLHVISGLIWVLGLTVAAMVPTPVAPIAIGILTAIDVITLIDRWALSQTFSAWDVLPALGIASVVGVVAVPLLGRAARLGRWAQRTKVIAEESARLAPHSPATGSTARALTKALVELAEHPDLPQKLAKILDAPLDDEAQELLVRIINRGGRPATQMSRLAEVLPEAENAAEFKKVLQSLAKVGELGDAHYRNVLHLAWLAIKSGERLSPKAIDGLAKLQKIAAAQGKVGSGSIARAMAHGIDGVSAKAILEVVDDVLERVGTAGDAANGVYDLVRTMGHPFSRGGRFIKSEGALGELLTLRSLLQRFAGKIQVLHLQEYQTLGDWAITFIRSGKEVTRGAGRITDLMVIIDNLLNYVEVKRWRVFHGVLDEAFVKALLEMQKDLVLLEKAKIANPLAAAPRIRWSFILGVGERGLKLEDLPRLAEQFASRLDDPALRTALESAFRGGPRPAEAVKDAAKAIEEFKTMLRRGQILEGVIG